MLALGAFTYTPWCPEPARAPRAHLCSLFPSPNALRVLPSLLLRLGGRPRNSGLPVAKCRKTPRNAPSATPSSQERREGWQRASLGLPMLRAPFGLIKKGPGGGVGAHGGLWVVPVRRPHPRREQRVQAVPGLCWRGFGLGQRSRSQSELLFRKNLSGGRASCGAGLGGLFPSR